MNKNYFSRGFILFTLLVMLTGCASIPFKPSYMDTGFSVQKVNDMAVLPIADLRRDKGIEVEYQKLMVGSLKTWLPKMGYRQVSYADTFGGVGSILEDDIDQGQTVWVKSLGQDHERWILLIALNDFATRKSFGTTFVAECSGYLYDKEQGKAVWQHKTTHEESVGGLSGMMMGGTVRNITLQACVEDLLTQLPTRNGKKWQGGMGGDKLYKALR
jgi:hypothetical protein